MRWAGHAGRKTLKGRDNSEDQGVDGRNIAKDLWQIRWEVVDWIHLAECRHKWWTFMNTIMNLRATLKVGNFLTGSATISF
jgi:hypothetical protein